MSAIIPNNSPAVFQRVWHLFDARGVPVGRLAQRAALFLTGKHKPTFSPHVDRGDYVVIVNAEKCHFSGKKWDQKLYRYHTGFPGGLKEIKAKDMLEKHPTFILRKAVMGMIHRNKLKTDRAERLKIYIGGEHPHQAQFPSEIMAQYEKFRMDKERLDSDKQTSNPVIKLEQKKERANKEQQELQQVLKTIGVKIQAPTEAAVEEKKGAPAKGGKK
jgi:large subunit ribosomal protein L13